MNNKYSKNFERDYKFYLKNINTFKVSGDYPPKVDFDILGVDAKRSFFIYDSTGKLVSTSEPKLLQSIIVCKKSVNLHIKMWAEGFADYTLFEQDIIDIENEFHCPHWIRKGIESQGLNIRLKKRYKD